MENESKIKDWPSSNYPIFFALVLLATTAVTLAMGDEPRAEEIAIYAYYFLVIGILIRFFELALPDNTLERLSSKRMRISGWLRQHTQKANANTQAHLPGIPHKKILYFNRAKFEKILAPVADISKNVAVFLSLFLVICVIYGLMIDWWTVKGYISNLVLIIFGFLTLHMFSRAGSYKTERR